MQNWITFNSNFLIFNSNGGKKNYTLAYFF